MYFEKNGYLVSNPQDLSFLTEDMDFTDDLSLAEIFNSNESALDAINKFTNGEERYEILRYNNTIWIDRNAKQPQPRNHEAISANANDISIFGD